MGSTSTQVSDIQVIQDILLGSYIAIQFEFLVLGLEICLFTWTLRAFLSSWGSASTSEWRQKPKDDAQTGRIVFLALSFAIAVLYTTHALLLTTSIWSLSNLRVMVPNVIEFSNKLLGGSTLALGAAGSAMQAATSLIGNGILLYRCYMFYEANFWIIALPLVLEVASLGAIIVVVIQETSLPIALTIGLKTGQLLMMAYYILTASVNVLLTSFIAFKILRTAHDIKGMFKGDEGSEQTSGAAVRVEDGGRVGGLQEYSGVVSILVESCAPLPVSAVLVAVGSAIGAHRWRNTIDTLWYAACALSPQLIIFRVMSSNNKSANNRGTYTATAPSELVFDRPETQGLTSQDLDGLDEEHDDNQSHQGS